MLVSVAVLPADQRCITCHPKEVAGYAQTGMAKSLAPMSAASPLPDGAFEHQFSKTSFTVHSTGAQMTQELTRSDETVKQTATFVVGSGNHAYGYLMQVGDYVFQSPLSYYTNKKLWDVAPGYENESHPDFARPVTFECLACHSGKPLPVADSINRYQKNVFAAYAISCDRCHGDVTEHLKSPVPGSIINPAKLTGAARSSVCEQCHLSGAVRIPNPGKSIADFTPGHVLEDYFTVYVAADSAGQNIKVISHAEQLALSRCARESGGKLWCGSCHNPHDKPQPTEAAAYFRNRCLKCHASTLDSKHSAEGRDCVSCHMQKQQARDGGHSAFTDHQITRVPGLQLHGVQPDTVAAWREPAAELRDRNLAIALVTVGLQNQTSAPVIRGYKMINQLAKDFPTDSAMYTTLGMVLIKGKEPEQALKSFRRAISVKPNYAPYYVNAATALMQMHQNEAAVKELEKANELDPLLQQPVAMLHQLYQDLGQTAKAQAILADYDKAMGISRH